MLLLIASRLMLLHATKIYGLKAHITHFIIRYHSVIHTKEVTGNIGLESLGLRIASRNNVIGKGKGKAVPLQAWSGPEGSRKLRFPDFMTTAQDGGKVVSPTHRPPSPPGNTPGTHFC